MRNSLFALTLLTLLLRPAPVRAAGDQAPDYARQIAPIFQKYCVACHNAQDKEGGLILQSHGAAIKGGDEGAVIVPGQSQASRMIQMLTGQAEPSMPPEDNQPPTPDEIKLIAAWIDAGALGPKPQESEPLALATPKIPADPAAPRAITSVAYSPDGTQLAVARFSEVELVAPADRTVIRKLSGHSGKVQSVRFSPDGAQLIAASGIDGLGGEVRVWNVSSAELLRTIACHRDSVYAAEPSPDGSLLATASYDRMIFVWDAKTGERLLELAGHNDAVYDLAFSPDSKVLASASGDQTVKLWNARTGIRLDTLNQPTKEQYTVSFSPDGRYVASGGADNRIRIWRLVSSDEPAINPLVYARYAHEGSVIQLAFSPSGERLASASEDRTVKLWETATFTEVHVYATQSDVPTALAFAPDGQSITAGRWDGSLEVYPVASTLEGAPAEPTTLAETAAVAAQQQPMHEATEQEPNDEPREATAIVAPVTVRGTIHAQRDGQAADIDLFRFDAKKGQPWMLEIRAARDKSPLDSVIEVLDAEGRPVERLLLQAVRDSYLEFRGKDSKQTGDFRLFNWEEMDLNEFLYVPGEVVKLYQYPRGPDSGFGVYPGSGDRWTFFDTTATTHALHEPCYIVTPHPSGTTMVANGLPVFPIYYKNDDDALRKWGTDSRIMFTAPADGSYLIRVSDARGWHGEAFTYQLLVSVPQPDFHVTLEGAGPTIGAGSGKNFTVRLDRVDGFDGEVRVDVTSVPPGFSVTTPLVVQAGHITAQGTINAAPDAQAPSEEQSQALQLTATATIAGREIKKPIDTLGQIKLTERPKLLVSLVPAGEPKMPPEIVISPGETVSATLRIERHAFDDRVNLEAHNLPHGVIVDNIGLNGILITEQQTERTVYVTAANWVPETTRLFYMHTAAEGGQTSSPIILHVRKKPETLARAQNP